MPQRNSGHMGGKFADKRKIMNPATGKYFALSDFYIGNTATAEAPKSRGVCGCRCDVCTDA